MERGRAVFDMVETGKRLAGFRRKANLTQMEVAEQLGISFQAVSYWERGKTMPDLSNLVRIAELYRVSIDEILQNERQTRAIRNLMQNHDAADLLEIISIVKPNEVLEAIERSEINVRSFDQMIGAAPYLEEEVLSKLVRKNLHLPESFSQVCAIASYIDAPTLNALAAANAEKVSSFAQLCEIAYRMEPTVLSRMVSNFTKAESFTQVCNIACFVERDCLIRLVNANAKTVEQFSQVCNLACFVDQPTVSRLAVLHYDKVRDFRQVHILACYVDAPSLAKIAMQNVELITAEEEQRNVAYYLTEPVKSEFLEKSRAVLKQKSSS